MKNHLSICTLCEKETDDDYFAYGSPFVEEVHCCSRCWKDLPLILLQVSALTKGKKLTFKDK